MKEKIKTIQFGYKQSGFVCDGKEDCCCRCVHHLQVVAHCLHVVHEGDCNCGTDMGFYVCTLFDDMKPQNEKAMICGKHGVCECFSPRVKDENGVGDNNVVD